MHNVPRTVLIVDDAQEDRLLIGRALRQDAGVDYHLLEAENGTQALAYLRERQPDCLLLACELPDTTGLTLLQTVVAQAGLHVYPVVMLTGASSIVLAVAAMHQGAHDFLSKADLIAAQVQRAVNNAIEKVALLRQLEEQRAWSQLTLASVSDGVITTDAEGCITFMNPTAKVLTGWRANEAQGQALDQILRLRDEITRQPVAARMTALLHTQQTITYHALLVGRDARAIPIDYSAAPIRDRLGNPSGVVLTLRDVSTHKAVEEALRQHEAQLNTILYNIPASVYILTTDHRYLLVNRIYEQENNITNAEISGQSVYDRWPPEIAEALAANERRALASKAPITIEESVLRDGERRFYATIKAPLLNEASEPYAIIGISTDITERKRAEEALRRREEQLHAIINAVPGLIAYVDRNERYQFVNATYGQWFVRPIEEIEGHTVQELSGAELYHQERHRLAQALAGQEVKTEATFSYPDGMTRTLVVNYIPHLDAAGQPQGFYVVDTDISERKQAEALLRQHADLLDQAHDAIIVWELGGVIRYWNRGAEAMYGWTRAEALGQVTHQLLQTQHPMALTEFEQILRRVGQWMGEVRHIKRNGQQLMVESRYVVTRQADGLYLVLETNRDITERQQVQEALRASEERYRTLFETMDEGFCVIEMLFDDAGNPVDYRFLEVNPTFERFTGLEKAVGKTARHLVPELESHWFEIYGHVALTGEPRRFVEGSEAMGRWFEVYAFRFGGSESRRVALLFNNITERKRAEDQLRSQEELLRQIADNVPGLIAYIGADERYRFVNATFETWFQHPRQQIIGSTVRELIGEEERARLSHYRQQALAGEIVSYETLFTYPDGVTRTVWGRYQPHIAADSTVLGFYLFVMDISERKQAEQALQQFNEQLEHQVKERTVELTKRLQELDQFAYVASHDLKAPLRAIDHLAQWISADAADLLPPASRDHLEKMRGRITRMEKLLDDLLAYSRADRYHYNIGKVDVNLLLDDIVRLVTPPQGFAVSVQMPLPVFVAHKVPLETVLRNLINNAIKHHDRTDGQVQVAVQDLGEFFEFSVSDDGPGIAPEFHERIFQIFQTLRPRDQVEGSGMGLAIVKKIVESRNGHITVASALGRGTTFRFTWPKA